MPTFHLFDFQNSVLLAFFWLLVAHAFGDIVFQSGHISRGKDHIQGTFTESWMSWAWLMSTHCLINGALVAIVTGSVVLGVAEMLCHGIIDIGKNERVNYGFVIDQVLHVLCKYLWALLLILTPFKLP